MDGYNESAMIAFLPMSADWCKLELPHLTLVYAGLIEERKKTDFNDMAKDASSISMMLRPFNLQVLSIDIFGEMDEQVDVLRLRPTPTLLAARSVVERWNESNFPFNPHCTIGPVGSFIDPVPTIIRFDRICVVYGEEMLTFWLKE